MPDYTLGIILGATEDRNSQRAAIFLLSQDERDQEGELFLSNGPTHGGYTIDSQVIYKKRFLGDEEVDGFRYFTRHKLREIGHSDSLEVRRIFRAMRNRARGEDIYGGPDDFILEFARLISQEHCGRRHDGYTFYEQVERHLEMRYRQDDRRYDNRRYNRGGYNGGRHHHHRYGRRDDGCCIIM